ncbi:vesicle transport V-SNARE protein amine-terminal protein (macronuclear) [Tetrahymena thermophila SB210]|uniref:Vesicle transport V-SNARE protein amine-terminal protein n=1 Tax=Tetrahymena thermophila (strain SB210) TaxID=312017 RepID=I7MAC6_TETTS|nr:vesicle transport V-SNARE protein amine-terminal protein [Tetrahymena thermophila SB210]EAS04326.2 vesicle transport V-SNARE protein amine-terminal protein [Tetrahymena thermophila SB210]|eukprot:XP_001024571.2 vesicle transport V-SNARE protein amine-terminal protein [Tetrahymena thermophila SB210]
MNSLNAWHFRIIQFFHAIIIILLIQEILTISCQKLQSNKQLLVINNLQNINMSSIEEQDENIESQFVELEKLIEKINNVEGQQRQNRIKNCELKLRNISTDLETFDFEISNLDRHEEDKYRVKHEKYIKKLKLLKNEFELKKNEGNEAAEKLFGDRKQKYQEDLEKVDIKKMDQDQMIQYANDVQMDGEKRLREIEGVLVEDIEIANQITIELDRQIDKLDSINQNVMDTQSMLKRTGKLITYFAKQVSTDKILMCLLCTIVVVIVVLIILSATGVGNGKFHIPV